MRKQATREIEKLSCSRELSMGSHEQQAQPSPHEIPTNSWYPPFVVSSPSSSRPTTPSSTSSSSFSVTYHATLQYVKCFSRVSPIFEKFVRIRVRVT
ncbi:hypothetical protein LOK49_LG03G02692 [Camellia lanceoleosa]|uniref:Uncharacterized protein n=1 Tax=Camellia lanceoleosa TaxID=1840588 RepID=A0ACC0IHZ1_9ERIC|nr:hypothetical protein LOK49_LG03G02692 [Camellia lanceoleosa]